MVRNNSICCPNCRKTLGSASASDEQVEIMCSKGNDNTRRISKPAKIGNSSSSSLSSSGAHEDPWKTGSLTPMCPCVNAHAKQRIVPKFTNYSKLGYHSHHPQRFSCQSDQLIDYGRGYCRLALFTLTAVLLLIPSTMSSPVPGGSGSGDHHRHHKDRNRLHERPAKWINPCRIPTNIPMASSDAEENFQTIGDADIFRHIRSQAAKAEKQASGFIHDFYKEAFGTETEKFGDIIPDWLADTMEIVNGEMSEEALARLPVEETIKMVYKGLQKFAVGLEAIVLDQACYGGSFYQHFNEAEYQLKYVLCELQIAMLEKNIVYEDITREIMAQEIRDVPDRATRNIRDYTIFRDYVKTLRYVEHAFRYYYNQAAATSPLESNGA